MKNLLSILALAAVVVLSGCKKGEEDPFLSFSSRDSRLAGTWNLTSGTFNMGYTYRNGAEDDQTGVETDYDYDYTLDGSIAKYAFFQEENGTETGSRTEEFPFTLSLEFDKSGTFTAHLVAQFPTNFGTGGAIDDWNQTASGNWSWINDGKNKTGIRLQQSAGAPMTDGVNLLNGNFSLKKLNGSEMTLVRNDSFKEVLSSETGGGGSIEVITKTQMLEFNMTKSE